MKAHSINYERGNEYTWPREWDIYWNCTTLIIKSTMKASNIPNEIFNESAHN